MIDKDVEKYRYDKEAEILLNADKLNQIEKTPKYLNTPYEFYFKILENKNSQSKLLEIGAGTGQNTGTLIDMSYKVCATDISLKSVELMNKRFYGCANFSAQYLQQPVKIAQGILKEEEITFYHNKIQQYDKLIISIDTAMKVTEKSDFSAITVWAIKSDKYYLIDLICKNIYNGCW